MWAAIRTLRLFTKSLTRIAASLESLESLYRLDLASRGVIQTNPALKDELEVQYGYVELERDV